MHKNGQTTKRYLFITCLNILITIAELLGGILSGSLALLSDAVHNLSDVGAIVLSFVAHLIGEKDRNRNKTFGYQRAEILAAFTNGVGLLVISVVLFIEAIERFFKPEKVDGTLMFWIAIIGLLANLVSMLTLKTGAKHNLNLRSTFVHMLADALSSLVVVFGAIVINFWQINWIDPILTMVVSIFISHEAVKITLKAANILMESNPGIDLTRVHMTILQHHEINNVHHVHIWRYSDDYIMLDAHLNVDKTLTCGEFEILSKKIGEELEQKFGINHVNLQVECERGKTDKMIYGKGRQN